MRTQRFSKFFLLLLSGLLAGIGSLAFAQEEGETLEIMEKAEGLTQGQVAVIMATRLGIYKGNSELLTQARAAQLLEDRGIKPEAGWDVDAAVASDDIARMIVQALGLEEEVENPEDPASYIALLIEKFGVDLSGAPHSTRVDDVPGDTRIGGSFDEPIPVSQKDLEEALNAITGGGDDGNNMTPSAP